VDKLNYTHVVKRLFLRDYFSGKKPTILDYIEKYRIVLDVDDFINWGLEFAFLAISSVYKTMDLDKLPYFAIKQDNDDIIVYNTTLDVEIDYDLDKNIHPLSVYKEEEIKDKEFLSHISSSKDIGFLSEKYEQCMEFKGKTYYILKKFRTYLEDRGKHQIKKTEEENSQRYEAYQQKIRVAKEDTTPMLKAPVDEEYSSSKVVTKKMKKLLATCWEKTKTESSHEVRDYLLESIYKIWINIPMCAEYDYEDRWDERQVFWSHFPPSWKTLFFDKHDDYHI